MKHLWRKNMNNSKVTGYGKKLIVVSLAAIISTLSVFAQTVVKMPKNKNPISKDIQLGSQYSAEAEKVFPVLSDSESTRYVQDIGRRLVRSIPSEYQHPEFNYEFKILNCNDINAFAIAAGHLYVCRGMIEGAKNEGEMVGVMAHEISHAALRHTTQQGPGLGTQLGAIGVLLGGAILGAPDIGQVLAAGMITKYSRKSEKEADLVGARIMANAGYDPHDLANMFKTIEQQSEGSRPPEWISSHPDPGKRSEYINAEANLLRVAPNPIRDSNDFQRQKRRLTAMTPKAKSMEELEKAAQGQQGSGQNPTAGGKYDPSNVQYPSARTRVYKAGTILTANVPDNWKEFPDDSGVTFAPENAYGDKGITHGVMLGVQKGQGGNLQTESDNYVQAIAKSNNYSQQGGYSRGSINGKNALRTIISGRSDVTGKTEVVTIYTTQLSDGSLLYVLTVSPENESADYSRAFTNFVNSIKINDR
jgi:beta-barrel assembly-enhancing protease